MGFILNSAAISLLNIAIFGLTPAALILSLVQIFPMLILRLMEQKIHLSGTGTWPNRGQGSGFRRWRKPRPRLIYFVGNALLSTAALTLLYFVNTYLFGISTWMNVTCTVAFGLYAIYTIVRPNPIWNQPTWWEMGIVSAIKNIPVCIILLTLLVDSAPILTGFLDILVLPISGSVYGICIFAALFIAIALSVGIERFVNWIKDGTPDGRTTINRNAGAEKARRANRMANIRHERQRIGEQHKRTSVTTQPTSDGQGANNAGGP